MKAVILGTTGYTGMVLLRLLSEHPDIEEIIPVSSSKQGTDLETVDPGIGKAVREKTAKWNGKMVDIKDAVKANPDVVFAGLPHLASARVCEPFFGKSVVVDLSADFRIKESELFLKAYGEEAPRKDLLESSIYGLCEIYHDEIKKYDIIANPGCYPTCTLLPVIPLASKGFIKGKIITNAMSGISGAGKKATMGNIFCERTENTCAYLPGQTHRHFTEIKKEINYFDNSLDLMFTPHLVPLKRGMHATTVFEMAKDISEADIAAVFEEYYSSSPFVNLKGNVLPETGDVWGSNRCDIAWQVHGNSVILFSAIDNLVKGASGQAVQNMNIRFGLNETNGLRVYGEL